jgi:diaminobutyrate-2-oxoglutarate transaminase
MLSESRVNVYGAAVGRMMQTASGPYLYDTEGRAFFDLFSSAGVCNFGHNHPTLKRKLISYLEKDGLVHGLDYFSASKNRFMDLLENLILPPTEKGRYHYYFSPPAGTLAIEAALKYARKFTGRQELACFTNGFHGLTPNALSLTGNAAKRRAAYCALPHAIRLPYEGYCGSDFDSVAHYRKLLSDPSGGADLPAALVLETVQAEGGCHTATARWHTDVLNLCRELRIVSIVDDIQAGIGRTESYFSFASLGPVWPDIICLSKSLSGMGLPLSLVMMRKELDVLEVGENSGTFRGNCLAVESAANTLELFADPSFQEIYRHNQKVLADFAQKLEHDLDLQVRGRGLLRGVVMPRAEEARQLVSQLRDQNILVETCGGAPEVIKIMPPISTDPELLEATLATFTHTLKGQLK